MDRDHTLYAGAAVALLLSAGFSRDEAHRLVDAGYDDPTGLVYPVTASYGSPDGPQGDDHGTGTGLGLAPGPGPDSAA